MKCAFCDHELKPELLHAAGCGACGGGCRKIHCPYCGQENPVMPEYLLRLLDKGRKA